MKKVQLITLLLSACLGLSLFLTSCSAGYKGHSTLVAHESEQERYQRNQERLRTTYGPYLEYAAAKLAEKVSDVISPMSGKEQIGKALLYDYEIVENLHQEYIACRAILKWQARDISKGVPYGWCELKGTIYFFPNHKGAMKAQFNYDERNSHVIAVSKQKHWNKLGEGLIITLK